MSENKKKKRLLEAAETETLEEVRAAFEACSADEQNEYGQAALWQAACNTGPYTLDIVRYLIDKQGVKADSDTLKWVMMNPGPCTFDTAKLLMERRVKADSYMLRYAAVNRGPCSLDLVKLITEQGQKHQHKKNSYGYTALILALGRENFAVADYLLSLDDFLPGDLIPGSTRISEDIYKTYRAKAISHVSKLIDSTGPLYARKVNADIDKMLKSKYLKPTKEDIEALQPLVRKIASMDWVADAQISSDDFLGCDIAR